MSQKLHKEDIRRIHKRKITPGAVSNQIQRKENILNYIKFGTYRFEDMEYTLLEIDEYLNNASKYRPEFFI